MKRSYLFISLLLLSTTIFCSEEEDVELGGSGSSTSSHSPTTPRHLADMSGTSIPSIEDLLALEKQVEERERRRKAGESKLKPGELRTSDPKKRKRYESKKCCSTGCVCKGCIACLVFTAFTSGASIFLWVATKNSTM